MMYDKLVEQNKIDKIFNNYLFQKGDSRNPELAGIGGALVGSFFTIIITCILYTTPSPQDSTLSRKQA